MSSTPEFFQALQRLIVDEMGWDLRFTNHEDGAELELFRWQPKTDFTPLHLMQSEGWIRDTDSADVIEQWLRLEQVGSINGASWLVPEQDPAQILLDSSTQAARSQHYKALLQVLQTQLQHIQALQFSCSSDYQLDLLVGLDQATDRWIAIAPIVPHATRIDQNAPLQPTSSVPDSTDRSIAQSMSQSALLQMQQILAQLSTIQLYGYYGGGYNQIHDYRLIQAEASTQSAAIEQGLIQSELLQIDRFAALHPRGDTQWQPQFAQLNQLLQQSFPQVWVYRFSFWNFEHFYIVRQAETGNWEGIVLRSQFTYNP